MIVLTSYKINKEEKETLAALFNFEIFFKSREKSTPCISPDNFFSYRADYKGKMNIYFKKVNNTVALHVTNDTSGSICGDENF